MEISKKYSLVILGITAIISSRAFFSFLDDPEGPNLLIVTVLAAIIYGISLVGYRYNPLTKEHGLKKLLGSVLVQILVVIGLYFFLG